MIEKLLPGYCISGKRFKKVDGIVVHHFSCMNVDPENQFSISACWQLMVDLNLPKEKRLHFLKDKRSRDGRSYVSAHCFIDREGQIYKLVDFGYRANHAGASIMNTQPHCNGFTIGVEMIGTANSGFTENQYDALSTLSCELMSEHGFDVDSIQGHDEVRSNAIEDWEGDNPIINWYRDGEKKRKPARKYDPSGDYDGHGTNFDWAKLTHLIDIKSQ